MGIAYFCERNKDPVIVVWDGTVNLEQWQIHLRRMLADSSYALARSQVSDLRYSVLDSSITEDTIRSTVELLAGQTDVIRGKRIAIIAGAQWEQAKNAELHLLRLAVDPIVFTDLVHACWWLGVDEVRVGSEIKRVRLALRGDS